MKEQAIRPHELMAEQKKFIKEDVTFLLKHRSLFKHVFCPACERLNKAVRFKKNGFTYLECSRCGMLYMSPRPSVELLSKFYFRSPNYSFFNEYIFPATCDVRRREIFAPRAKKVLEVCKKNKIPPEKILEIGVGFGLFCEEIAKLRFFKEVVGVEASSSLHDTCAQKGFRVYNGLLEKLEIKEKFIFVTAFEVIEHIFSPLKFLKKINKLLSKNGFLMLTFPNYNGFDIGMLGAVSSVIDHEHQNYFNEKSIEIILNRAGFNLIEIKTPGKLDVDLVKNAFAEGLLKNSFISLLSSDRFEACREKFQKFLANKKLSSHMLIVARKFNPSQKSPG